jgi:hypothetical protein
MMQVSHIFVSYNQADSDFSEILHSKIEQAGFVVWRDSSGLRGGDDWRKGIDDAIKGACVLVVVMTPEAKASEYVTYEWAFAWGAGVKVIPLLLKRTQLHPRLESLQYLDFSNRHIRPWDALIALLREAESSSPVREGPQIAKRNVDQRDTKNRDAEPASFRHKAVLISINRSSAETSLYEATRYAWKIKKSKAKQAEIILATVRGLIVGAFVADDWLPATSANFPGHEDMPGRLGFVGREAPANISALYVGKRVPDEYRKRGAANPVKYSWKA